jgi:hypothetical protein
MGMEGVTWQGQGRTREKEVLGAQFHARTKKKTSRNVRFYQFLRMFVLLHLRKFTHKHCACRGFAPSGFFSHGNASSDSMNSSHFLCSLCPFSCTVTSLITYATPRATNAEDRTEVSSSLPIICCLFQLPAHRMTR